MLNLLTLLNRPSAAHVVRATSWEIEKAEWDYEGRGTWGMKRGVRKFDCLLGCKVMRTVPFHSLKGHTELCITQPTSCLT